MTKPFFALILLGAEFEARGNQPINSFVLPYCAYTNGSDKRCPPRIGEALLRSGELGSPEYSQKLEAEYGMPDGSRGTSLLFSINDRNPSAERFDREIEKRLAGRNRLVALYAATGGQRLLSVSKEESPNVPVTFVHR